jgi:hypothetical protein
MKRNLILAGKHRESSTDVTFKFMAGIPAHWERRCLHRLNTAFGNFYKFPFADGDVGAPTF